jgi:hypothetical protein
MKIQSSLNVVSRSDYGVASETTARTTRTQIGQVTTDVVAKALKSESAGLRPSLANDTGGLWAVMIEYQKTMNKEAREDRKVARADAQTELTGKAANIAPDISNADQMKEEASERFNHPTADDPNALVQQVLR